MYRTLANVWAERAPKSRSLPDAPLAAARFFGSVVVHPPSGSEPLLIVKSSVDGRLFALGSNEDGETVCCEVER